MERDDEKEAAPVTSPDGKYTAYIKNQNVYVKELATGKEKQLSLDGTPSNYYSVYSAGLRTTIFLHGLHGTTSDYMRDRGFSVPIM